MKLKNLKKEGVSLSKKDFIADLKEEYKEMIANSDYNISFETFLLNKLYKKTIDKKSHY